MAAIAKTMTATCVLTDENAVALRKAALDFEQVLVFTGDALHVRIDLDQEDHEAIPRAVRRAEHDLQFLTQEAVRVVAEGSERGDGDRADVC